MRSTFNQDANTSSFVYTVKQVQGARKTMDVYYYSNNLVLMNLPLPPSVNQMYAGKTRRFATPALKDFKKQMEDYRKKNRSMLEIPSRNFVKHCASSNDALFIERFFFLLDNRLICKDGSTKRFDVSNYIKAIDDTVCEILGLDDKHIWKATELKIPVRQESLEGVSVKISLMPRPPIVT